MERGGRTRFGLTRRVEARPSVPLRALRPVAAAGRRKRRGRTENESPGDLGPESSEHSFRRHRRLAEAAAAPLFFFFFFEPRRRPPRTVGSPSRLVEDRAALAVPKRDGGEEDGLLLSFSFSFVSFSFSFFSSFSVASFVLEG